jgi:hypothetical protein
MLRRQGRLAAVLAALCASLAVPALAGATPAPLPAGWPSATMQLGLRDDEGGAAALGQSTKLRIRYHYLSGGVNTGRGWSTWAQGGGSFVTGFIDDSVSHGFLPVFSYYQLPESSPGTGGDEQQGDLLNLRTPQTMKTWFEDLKLFFAKANQTGQTAVLHVEPDLWGYIEKAELGNGGRDVPVAVASTGLTELQGLPNDASGLARAVVRLRDAYAKHVLLGYHLSVWGTGEDIGDSDPSDAHVDQLAAQAASFYQGLHANFDLVFAETANRDAGYRKAVDGDDRGWWTAQDFARNVRFLGDVANTTGKRIVMWQTPLGNTAMRSMNNTYGHYQDNRVQWLLDGATGRDHLKAYANAGVIAFLFGAALDGATCACDARHDGVTNPAPISGNTRTALSADDDGGLFRSLANGYYAAGTVALPAATVSGGKPGKSSGPARFTISTTRAAKSVHRGTTFAAKVRVRASKTTRVVVAVQYYKPGARSLTAQVSYRSQTLRGGKTKTFNPRYKVPSGARRGGWKVKVGVFDANFKKLLQWSENAARFTVR